MVKWAMGLLLVIICAGCASNDPQGAPGNNSGNSTSEDRRFQNRSSTNIRNPGATFWSP